MIIEDWSGGFERTAAGHESLVMWGGSYDYGGNEQYAIDLRSASKPSTIRFILQRPPTLPGSCGCTTRPNFSGFPPNPAKGACGDGNTDPAPRHSYSQLAYDPTHDQFFISPGGACPAASPGLEYSCQDAWIYDFATDTYTKKTPFNFDNGIVTFGDNGGPGSAATDYSVAKGLYYIVSNQYFASYNSSTNTVHRLSSKLNDGKGYAAFMRWIVDDNSNAMWGFGCTNNPRSCDTAAIVKIDLTTGADTHWFGTSIDSSCEGIRLGSGYPGATVDTATHKIVLIPRKAGNTVYLYDTADNRCTSFTAPGGPPAPSPIDTGVHGRFQYVPSYNIFVFVGSASQDAYALCMQPKGC